MRSHSGMLALSPHPIEQLDSLESWYFLLTLVTYWVYLAHLLVGLQVVQKAVPVFGVVIDSVVSDAVDIGQNPLSILGNQFLFSFCNMKSRFYSARHTWDKCGTDWQTMKKHFEIQSFPFCTKGSVSNVKGTSALEQLVPLSYLGCWTSSRCRWASTSLTWL